VLSATRLVYIIRITVDGVLYDIYVYIIYIPSFTYIYIILVYCT